VSDDNARVALFSSDDSEEFRSRWADIQRDFVDRPRSDQRNQLDEARRRTEGVPFACVAGRERSGQFAH